MAFWSPEVRDQLGAVAALLPAAVERLEPIAPDASTRHFLRLRLADASTVVACLYPTGEEERLARDWAVQQWAWRQRLPIPRPLAVAGRVTVSADLGDCQLAELVRCGGFDPLPATLDCLARFQACPPVGLPNPPFDAAFFRVELEGFIPFLPASVAARPTVREFLDDLAKRLSQHPYRLVHRDFHVNNLLFHEGAVWAVDFQDMRAGPDTYDVASLLRERAGGEAIQAEDRWQTAAAARFNWPTGWEERYLECACQRGLKVLGTFLRLAQRGRDSYLRYVPTVAAKTRQALEALGAPAVLTGEVARLAELNAYNRGEEEA